MMFSNFTKVPSEGKLYQDHSSDTDDSNTSSQNTLFSPHNFLHKTVEGYLRCCAKNADFTIFSQFHNLHQISQCVSKLHSFTKFQVINVEYKRVKSCQYRFLMKYEHFNHFEHFFNFCCRRNVLYPLQAEMLCVGTEGSERSHICSLVSEREGLNFLLLQE